jgi:hypothetical protein
VAAHARTVELVAWDGPWDRDDPDANFKADVALYSHVDPMATISRLASSLDLPEGALVHYVLAKWASAGSGGLLELGPSMVHRLWDPIELADGAGTSEGRLEAYEQLRQMISWLRWPLVDDPDSAEAEARRVRREAIRADGDRVVAHLAEHPQARRELDELGTPQTDLP